MGLITASGRCPGCAALNTIPIAGVVIVTTPQDLALMDASRSLAFFRKRRAPVLGVIENMSYLRCPHCGEPIDAAHPLVTGNDATAETQVFREIAAKIVAKLPTEQADE